MKILAISSRIPSSGKKGDQVVSFFRLMHLARSNTVVLVCFGDITKAEDREAKQALEALGIVVHFVLWKPFVALAHLLKAIFNPLMPFQCALFQSGKFKRRVNTLRIGFKPDALYCVMVRVFPNIAQNKSRVFVDMVDSMGLNFSRRVSMAKGLKRWLLDLECRRVCRFERNVALQATQSFVVSKIDQKSIGIDKVHAIPLGIDMQQFNKNRGNPKPGPVIAFTGNMGYQPNIDAVQWFIQNCWPQIKSLIPEVQLIIAGSNPHPSVLTFGKHDSAIKVTGRVPSVAAILNTASVAIAPMQSGSGMQFKILEAMACATPTVTTSLGLGDISATPGKDIMVADSSPDFIQAVLSLLASTQLSAAIGDSGMEYVRNHHSWEAINEQFVEICGIS
ncbi:glycosyltransferase family 4 protein [Collimonas pratensis]|uniref:Glycosyl transferases group 1 family protein n=1 Tax=Collimonas pratensis TaxID=279113 RepID=A0A127PZY9_9BURK|nr:glycosyltransferase family 4 protein [Collimonas pratensis]AMP03324.1 glycosyl transferases group 1 family protein [Collimonas pratensis]